MWTRQNTNTYERQGGRYGYQYEDSSRGGYERSENVEYERYGNEWDNQADYGNTNFYETEQYGGRNKRFRRNRNRNNNRRFQNSNFYEKESFYDSNSNNFNDYSYENNNYTRNEHTPEYQERRNNRENYNVGEKENFEGYKRVQEAYPTSNEKERASGNNSVPTQLHVTTDGKEVPAPDIEKEQQRRISKLAEEAQDRFERDQGDEKEKGDSRRFEILIGTEKIKLEFQYLLEDRRRSVLEIIHGAVNRYNLDQGDKSEAYNRFLLELDEGAEKLQLEFQEYIKNPETSKVGERRRQLEEKDKREGEERWKRWSQKHFPQGGAATEVLPQTIEKPCQTEVQRDDEKVEKERAREDNPTPTQVYLDPEGKGLYALTTPSMEDIVLEGKRILHELVQEALDSFDRGQGDIDERRKRCRTVVEKGSEEILLEVQYLKEDRWRRVAKVVREAEKRCNLDGGDNREACNRFLMEVDDAVKRIYLEFQDSIQNQKNSKIEEKKREIRKLRCEAMKRFQLDQGDKDEAWERCQLEVREGLKKIQLEFQNGREHLEYLEHKKAEKEKEEKERQEEEERKKQMEQAEKERLYKEEQEQKERKRIEKEKEEKYLQQVREKEKIEKEKLERERVKKEEERKRREEEKAKREKEEKERVEKEILAKERVKKAAIEKAEREQRLLQHMKEKEEKEKLEKEKEEKEKQAEVEKEEQQRLERKKREQEENWKRLIQCSVEPVIGAIKQRESEVIKYPIVEEPEMLYQPDDISEQAFEKRKQVFKEWKQRFILQGNILNQDSISKLEQLENKIDLKEQEVKLENMEEISEVRSFSEEKEKFEEKTTSVEEEILKEEEPTPSGEDRKKKGEDGSTEEVPMQPKEEDIEIEKKEDVKGNKKRRKRKSKGSTIYELFLKEEVLEEVEVSPEKVSKGEDEYSLGEVLTPSGKDRRGEWKRKFPAAFKSLQGDLKEKIVIEPVIIINELKYFTTQVKPYLVNLFPISRGYKKGKFSMKGKKNWFKLERREVIKGKCQKGKLIERKCSKRKLKKTWFKMFKKKYFLDPG